MALQFEARKIALKQDRTGYVLTVAIHPDEIPEELLRDFVGARYGCALLCRNPHFQEFVAERLVGHSVDEDGAAAALCKQCGIASRSELNGNTKAQETFDAIILDYENWSPNADTF
jgi:hypothetical protein